MVSKPQLQAPGFSHGVHDAPNEFFEWEQAAGGIAAFACLFEQLARMTRDSSPR